jgi:AcrR family transcriptional regulator
MFKSDTKALRKGSPAAPREATAEEKLTRGEAAREQILDTAIGLFRHNGFDETTMREVAAEAGVALGLTYHYFPSKEALVMAYYERVQREHRAVADERMMKFRNLRDRFAMLHGSKLDILQRDRKLLGALFRYTGNPEHPLSFLGKGTAALRKDCMSLFSEAMEGEKLPDDLQELLPVAMWALHMGVMLYFLYDPTPGQIRTRKLIGRAMDVAMSFVTLAKLPLLRPVRRSVMNLLREAELIPER